jgi:hypothetical protein
MVALLSLGWAVIYALFPSQGHLLPLRPSSAPLEDFPKERMPDGSHLRILASAWQVTERDSTTGQLPEQALADIHSLARFLARYSGIKDARLWLSHYHDPAMDITSPPSADQLVIGEWGANTSLNPQFRDAPLAWAVALVPGLSGLPPGTPFMWTRGLRPDGTWREDSPYRGYGGFIAVTGQPTPEDGSPFPVVRFYRRLGGDSEILKWGTKQPTANIMEALPPGIRISEYTPSPDLIGKVRSQLFRERVRSACWLLLPLAGLAVCARNISNPVRKKFIRGLLLIPGLVFSLWFWALALS